MFKDKNHFDLFDLSPAFSVDLERLEAFYRKLNQQFHPDVVSQGSSREKLEATLLTAQINEAYETLKTPLKRGYYLLKLLDPNGETDQDKTVKDPDLLLEAYENQEALSLAKTPQDIEPLLETGQAKKASILLKVEKDFDHRNLTQARLNLYRYRYYDKLMSDAKTQLSEKLKDNASTA
tara:strand:- start:1293 stop:1829 length:537 start_codon:yes stop_codon:yes gene_type:complete